MKHPPVVHGTKNKNEKIKEIVRDLIELIGEDNTRTGLIDTPQRVAKMYGEIFSGYVANSNSLVTTFPSEGFSDMIVVKDIDFHSNCEHHMVPFFGKAHIAYIPDKEIIGLSKFGRIVEHFAKRLQVQERLTNQIADYIEEKLAPKGLIVQLDAKHLCMVMRGIKKATSSTTTSAVRGSFLNENLEERREFSQIVKSTP